MPHPVKIKEILLQYISQWLTVKQRSALIISNSIIYTQRKYLLKIIKIYSLNYSKTHLNFSTTHEYGKLTMDKLYSQ